MHLTKLISIFGVAGMVMACEAEGGGPYSGFLLPKEDTCDAAGAAEILRSQKDALEILAKEREERKLRILLPNTIMTMDYRPDRLNIDVDDAGDVTRLYCG